MFRHTDLGSRMRLEPRSIYDGAAQARGISLSYQMDHRLFTVAALPPAAVCL